MKYYLLTILIAIMFSNSSIAQTATTQKKGSLEKSISQVWKEFQTAVKKGKKADIISFFRLPFDIQAVNVEDYNAQSVRGCYRPICKLAGAASKSKLEENYKIIFDKAVTDGILKSKADEYTDGNSARYNKLYYQFEISIPTKYGEPYYDNGAKVKKVDGIISYNFYFIEVNGEYKIYLLEVIRRQ